MFLDGSCFHPMASALGQGGATVYVPDLRGHGASGGRRGDVDHVGQLDDDLVDVLVPLRARHPAARVALLGHSSGGALVVRHAGGRRDAGIGGTALLAPFLGGEARTTRPDPGGWVTVDVARFADVSRRAAGGDGSGQDQVVLRFDPPASSPAGVTAHAYTYRMMASLAPRADLGSELSAIVQPLLVVAGSRDGCFVAEQYEPTISPHAKGTFHVLPGLTHLGLLLSPLTWAAVEEWSRYPG
jgi:alpha-beta hydrolase superfamily lysophospholipase